MAPPKNKGGNKKSKGADGEDAGSSSKVKPAQSINVRHILVREAFSDDCVHSSIPTDMIPHQCEKHSKKEEALAKIRSGTKFDEVAREFSEDKARQG